MVLTTSHLLIAFANSLEPDQNVGPDILKIPS